MTCEICLTDEVDEWLQELVTDDALAYRQVVYAIEALAAAGTGLGRPLVDRVRGSTIRDLLECRPAPSKTSEVRLLFVFDPHGQAVILTAGANAGSWFGWYREAITMAERRYAGLLDPGEGGTNVVRWAEAREVHLAAIGQERVRRGRDEALARVCAYRLADLRRRRGLTQRDVAGAMGVTFAQVSRIEEGDLAHLDLLNRYVVALGGRLELVACVGDERLRMR
jgi:hypothetical protein